jgi:asparagine synthase (glutamine-hydrolysing)
MCGIAGVFEFNGRDATIPVVLRRMSDAMIHRGPDDCGAWAAPHLQAGLTVRRLSIVDLVTGNQPLWNEDESLALVCNGEIYNHRALRKRLMARGHRFRSTSDCEVIVHLYEEYGEECLLHLEGMFGLAIFDIPRRSLLLARDPAGMKPLYYARTPAGFFFASEIKALLATQLIRVAPDWSALNSFLSVDYSIAPGTSFEGISSLCAGERILLKTGSELPGFFHRVKFGPEEGNVSEEDYAARLETLLDCAVASHLDADVQVGSFLSGGWDSSLVAWFAAHRTSKKLKTYSLVFPEEPAENEARFSRLVANQIGSDHQEVEFRTAMIPELLERSVEAAEDPQGSSPAPLIYHLCSVAGRELKVVLSGEGSDELFAGYPWLRARILYQARALAGALPRPVLGFLGRRILDPRWGRAFRILSSPSARDADLEWLRLFTPHQKKLLLNPQLPMPLMDLDLDLKRPPAETLASCRDRLQERLSVDLTRRLPDELLRVEDKMSMAHSLEVRMPFLDKSVFDFGLALPSRFKLKNGREKYILSKLTDRLPPEIRNRRKYGLHFPMLSPPTERFIDYLRERLLDSTASRELFQRPYLEQMLNRALPDRREAIKPLWSLTTLTVWWDRFMVR